MAQALHNALQERQIEDSVSALCFDTTILDTGHSAGVCIILEKLLGRHLLHFAYRHHILEIILESVFQESPGSAGAPEMDLFKHF